MGDLTKLLHDAQSGDPRAAEEILPIVYNDLRRLARYRLAREGNGQSMQATALVHEAYVRLVGKQNVDWNGTGHFFAAAAESMRRIVVDQARIRAAKKRGGDMQRIELSNNLPETEQDDRLLDLDEALDALADYDARKAEVVKVRFFAGLSIQETAEALQISTATATRDWIFARAWLKDRMA